MKNTWQPITPTSPIKEGDYIGGYDSHIKWRRAKVKRCNAEQRIFQIDFRIATHWTSDAPPYELPKPPKDGRLQNHGAGFLSYEQSTPNNKRITAT
jgi:hypothetical protein